MSALTITFRQAREAGACRESYRRMAEALGGVTAYGDREPVSIERVLDVLGFEDALWALEATGRERDLRLFAADCAERVLPIFEARCPGDDRPRRAVEVARRFVRGEASAEELDAARDAAWDAARDAAWDAARDAAWGTAWAAAWDARAAWYAAWAAANAAARDAAWDAARDAAWDAARDAERAWQVERLRAYLRGEEDGPS